MRIRSGEMRLLGGLIFAVLLLGVLGAASSAPRQAAQQANSQQQTNKQRPRKVGGQTNTPPPTSTPTEEVAEGDIVRVETQLVSVPTVVTDRSGHPLSGLRLENFTLLEDGKPQRITNFATTETPFEIALLLDTSGSTREELGLIRDAANAFISALRPGDRVAIVAFNNTSRNRSLATVEVVSPLADDRQALRRAITRPRPSKGKPFYEALGRLADQAFLDPPR